MEKYQKKVALLLTICLMLFSFPSLSLASSAGTVADESDFAFDAATGTITRYIGAGGDVIIPSTIGGVAVKSIGEGAFENCYSLTKITIPESVTSLEYAAFWYCDSLTTVTIPDSVTSIGNYAFIGCKSLNKITIPNSVTSIGDAAFEECHSLTEITIPDRVTSIGGCAFSDCESLTSVTIPNSVVSIGDAAFSGCKSLTSVTIPNSVTNIGKSIFWGCKSLTEIPIPESVKSIGGWAFYECTSLETVYYAGTEDQWNAITIGNDNDPLLKANIIFGGKLPNSLTIAPPKDEAVGDSLDKFGDIDPSKWFYEAVKWAYDNKYMVGVSDNQFVPNAAISHATLIATIARLGGIDTASYANENFADVTNDKWYTNAAKWAKLTGLLDGKFEAEQAMPRGELAMILVKYLKYLGVPVPEAAENITFADAAAMSEAEYQAFNQLYQLGVFRGKNGSEVVMNAAGSTTRAELATLLRKMDEIIQAMQTVEANDPTEVPAEDAE